MERQKWKYGNDGDLKWRVVKLPPAPRPEEPKRDYELECGCAWNLERYAMIDDRWRLVARPPDPSCVVCKGYGKIKDRRGHIAMKVNIGSTDERGRVGYHRAHHPMDAVAEAFPDENYLVRKPHYFRGPTGRSPGRPKTTISTLEATVVYVMDVRQEVLREYAEALEHFTGEKKQKALELISKITLARAPAASPSVLAQSGQMSRATYYRWRKEGQVFLGQLDRIENQLGRIENKLNHASAMNDLRAQELFRAVGKLDEEAALELDSEA